MTGSRLIRVAALVAASTLTGSVLVIALGAWTTVVLFLALATLAAAALPLAQRVRAGRFDLLEPIVGSTIVLAVVFGIRPIAMLVADDFVYRDVDIAPHFPYTVALGLLGTVAFVAAYEWARHKLPASSSQGRESRISRPLAFGSVAVLALLSVLLFGLHLSRLGSNLADGFRLLVGGQSPDLVARWAGTSEYLSTSPILAACGATLLGIATRWRLTRFQLLFFVVLIAYPVAMFYLSGTRRYMVPCLLVPLVTWMLMSVRRPGGRLLLALIPISFLILATIPFARWVGTRDDATGGIGTVIVQAIEDPARAVHRFILGPDTNMLPALAREVSVLTAPEDFFYGRATVGDLFLAPIPHLIFPDKPQSARDELLTRTFGAPCRLAGDGVCDDFSIIGTFYQDFWVPGVAILMGGVGAASAWLWSRWHKSPGDQRLIVATGTWVVFVPIIFRAGFMPGFQWWLYFFVPCLLGVMVFMRPPEPHSHDATAKLMP